MTIAHLHPAGSITILLIDPDKEDREYWAQRLTASSPDYMVLEAETGTTGLAICRSQPVDCVLLEMNLSDMSGFQVLVDLVPLARHPDIAVIMLSRIKLLPMAELAMKNGAQACLFKALTSGDELDRTIRKALAAVAPKRKTPRS